MLPNSIDCWSCSYRRKIGIFPSHCEYPFSLLFCVSRTVPVLSVFGWTEANDRLVMTRAVNVGIVACLLHTIPSNDSEQPRSLNRASAIALSLARVFNDRYLTQAGGDNSGRLSAKHNHHGGQTTVYSSSD